MRSPSGRCPRRTGRRHHPRPTVEQLPRPDDGRGARRRDAHPRHRHHRRRTGHPFDRRPPPRHPGEPPHHHRRPFVNDGLVHIEGAPSSPPTRRFQDRAVRIDEGGHSSSGALGADQTIVHRRDRRPHHRRAGVSTPHRAHRQRRRSHPFRRHRGRSAAVEHVLHLFAGKNQTGAHRRDPGQAVARHLPAAAAPAKLKGGDFHLRQRRRRRHARPTRRRAESTEAPSRPDRRRHRRDGGARDDFKRAFGTDHPGFTVSPSSQSPHGTDAFWGQPDVNGIDPLERLDGQQPSPHQATR